MVWMGWVPAYAGTTEMESGKVNEMESRNDRERMRERRRYKVGVTEGRCWAGFPPPRERQRKNAGTTEKWI